MKKALLLLLLFLLLLWLLWRWWNAGAAVATDEGARLAFDRAWMDHRPRSPSERWQSFWIISQHPVGGFNAGTFWKGGWERFQYRRAGDGRLDAIFQNDRERISYRAWRCDTDGFDFCLEIGGSSRGVKRYYSQRGWEIHQGADAEARVREIASASDGN